MTRGSLKQEWAADPTGRIGAAVMLGFAVVAAWRWQSSGLLFFALTTLRDVAAAWFLLTRRPDTSGRPFGWPDVLAYASSGLPLLYLSGEPSLVADVLAIVGFALATVALFELGKSFGVSPANRGRVSSGVYRYLSHPIYVGYMMAESAMCLVNVLNASLVLLSAVLYLIRATLEAKVLRIMAQESIKPKAAQPNHTLQFRGVQSVVSWTPPSDSESCSSS